MWKHRYIYSHQKQPLDKLTFKIVITLTLWMIVFFQKEQNYIHPCHNRTWWNDHYWLAYRFPSKSILKQGTSMCMNEKNQKQKDHSGCKDILSSLPIPTINTVAHVATSYMYGSSKTYINILFPLNGTFCFVSSVFKWMCNGNSASIIVFVLSKSCVSLVVLHFNF